MDDDAEKGQVEAHTPASAAGDAADRHDQVQDPMIGLFDGRDVADLLTGSPDLVADDLLSIAAELTSAPRRGRGRPPGSPNRKNAEMVGYLQALGHRDPWVTLSMIQTADTRDLAKRLRRPLMKNGKVLVNKSGGVIMSEPDYPGALALQMRAAEALMPYHHAKMPVQLELGDKAGTPWMAIGEMTVNVMNGPLDGVMSAGEMIEGEKANEINGPSVRSDGQRSHETAKPLKTIDDPPQNG